MLDLYKTESPRPVQWMIRFNTGYKFKVRLSFIGVLRVVIQGAIQYWPRLIGLIKEVPSQPHCLSVHFEDYIWKNWDFTHLYPYFWWKGLLHQLGNMKSIKYVEYNVFKPLPVLSEQTCSHTTKHDTRTIPTGCHVSSQAPGFRIRRKRTRPMMRWLQISVIARVSSFVDVLWLYSAEGF